MREATQLSAVELVRHIRARDISPPEAVEAYLGRIQRLNPTLNAFAAVDAEGALRQARAAQEAVARGAEVGPLHGVPMTIKSSVEVAGLPFEGGTRLRTGVRGVADAPLVARLKAAGAIVLGSTNTPEFLMAYETDNELYGRVNNPWDLARTPGGSSGGESAAIAAGMSAGGIGSDGGGSVRVPAHFSGICGLKPTPGRIPVTGHYPPSGGPFAITGVVGPMARTVADVRLLFEITAGLDYGDPSGAPVPLRQVSAAELKGLRVGYFEDDGVTPVTPETAAAVRAAAQSLRRQGFQVEPFRPNGLEELRRVWWLFFVISAREVLSPMVVGRETEISPILAEFLDISRRQAPLTGEMMLNGWILRDQVRASVLAQMERYPLLLCPVCAVPAFRHRQREWTIAGREVGYISPERDIMAYSQWWNVLGSPGVSVPVGASPEGLPIGVQIVGRPWEEERVLALAAAVERDFGFQAPPLSWMQAGAQSATDAG